VSPRPSFWLSAGPTGEGHALTPGRGRGESLFRSGLGQQLEPALLELGVLKTALHLVAPPRVPPAEVRVLGDRVGGTPLAAERRAARVAHLATAAEPSTACLASSRVRAARSPMPFAAANSRSSTRLRSARSEIGSRASWSPSRLNCFAYSVVICVPAALVRAGVEPTRVTERSSPPA
jgi:hypothetical protein